VADLGPALDQAKARPVLGQGFGTRITDNGQTKANILDNQWLGTLLETGALGVLAWIWLFFRTVRRLIARGRGDPSDLGLLRTALAGSILAFAVGLFTYDAFSFIQVTYVMFILVALSCVLDRLPDETPPDRPARAEAAAA
jgi:O-antigen ligase